MLADFFPPPEIILQLQSEELAIPLLKSIINEEEAGRDVNLTRGNYMGLVIEQRLGGEYQNEVQKNITEAWSWLEREIMIAPRPQIGGGSTIYVTGRGKELVQQEDINVYIRSNIIPRGALDPKLTSKVQHLFLRGDYDTAVFAAFKEVEIRVRRRARLPSSSYGVNLMREAFKPERGKLTNTQQISGEQQATMELFAGTIGLFKNPSSHREVNWEEPAECAELIYLANHLLRIIDKHATIAQQ